MRQRTGQRRRLADSIRRMASPAAMPTGRRKMMGVDAPCQVGSVLTTVFFTRNECQSARPFQGP
jgi:hypothetical protein